MKVLSTRQIFAEHPICVRDSWKFPNFNQLHQKVAIPWIIPSREHGPEEAPTPYTMGSNLYQDPEGLPSRLPVGASIISSEKGSKLSSAIQGGCDVT